MANMYYRDKGCEFATSCQSCPFPICVYECVGGKRGWLNKLRNKEIIKSFTNENKTTKELAQIYAISQRSVRRILKPVL